MDGRQVPSQIFTVIKNDFWTLLGKGCVLHGGGGVGRGGMGPAQRGVDWQMTNLSLCVTQKPKHYKYLEGMALSLDLDYKL